MEKGDRVKYSKWGIKNILPRNPSVEGIVVGHGRSPGILRVVWDGTKTPYSYFNGYLARIREQGKSTK